MPDPKTILITGATSGIGQALVHQMAAQHWRVIAVGRREPRLKELAERTGAMTLALDVSDTEALERALGDLPPLDAFVASAGIARSFGSLTDASRQDVDQTFAVNTTSVAHALRMVLPGMRDRQRGHIVLVGSVAGVHPTLSAIYGASKGALHLMAQNLRLELGGSGVRVTEVLPGRVNTEFFEVNFEDEALRRQMGSPPIDLLEAKDVAATIAFALAQPAHVNIERIDILPTGQAMGGSKISPR